MCVQLQVQQYVEPDRKTPRGGNEVVSGGKGGGRIEVILLQHTEYTLHLPSAAQLPRPPIDCHVIFPAQCWAARLQYRITVPIPTSEATLLYFRNAQYGGYSSIAVRCEQIFPIRAQALPQRSLIG